MNLAHYALELPWEPADCVEALWDELVLEIRDPASAALQHVFEWATAHQEEFWQPGRSDTKQPLLGWVGHWARTASSQQEHVANYAEVPGWQWIGFIPARLHEILERGEFEPKSTIRVWKDRGWLESTTEADGTVRSRMRARIGRDLTWLVAIRVEAVQSVEND